MNWSDEAEDDLYDVVVARDIVPPDGRDVLEIQPGDCCKSVFMGRTYDVKVIEVGKSDFSFTMYTLCAHSP